MSKRKVSFDEDVETPRIKKTKEVENVKKHSLDSDEEDDNNDVYNVMDEDDIEGEEDGVAGNEDGIRTTAFNMREEMEEGYFDKDGHFLWNKDKEIRDNWLDNIDWHQIKPQDKNAKTKNLGDDSDSDDDDIDPNAKQFNEIDNYKQILTYMEPKENITKSLRRLGGANKKLSSVERLKLKKAGLLELNNDKVIKLTELANEILNQTGNMDIYQETYEHISNKIKYHESKNKKPKEQELDMYADDFDVKEKKRLVDDPGPSTTKMDTSIDEPTEPAATPVLMWEFKWKVDSDKIEGPHNTEQMQKYVDEGKFKDGVWVRKTGQDQFYSSSRIDFELYLS